MSNANVFLGQIQPVALNYAPQGWLPCDGRLLPIGQYQDLFSLLGTKYGGDGKTNFGLPNLNARAAMGFSEKHPMGASSGDKAINRPAVKLNSAAAGAHGSTAVEVATPGAVLISQPSLVINYIIAVTGVFPEFD